MNGSTPADDDVWRDGALSVAGAREFLGMGVGRSHLYKLMNEGRLTWTHVGKRRLIAKASLRALLSSGVNNP